MLLLPKEQMLEWIISTEDESWEKLNAFDKMSMEFYGSRTVSRFRRILRFAARSWTWPIALDILSIRESTRCIEI
jgi:hypothetical protein